MSRCAIGAEDINVPCFLRWPLRRRELGMRTRQREGGSYGWNCVAPKWRERGRTKEREKDEGSPRKIWCSVPSPPANFQTCRFKWKKKLKATTEISSGRWTADGGPRHSENFRERMERLQRLGPSLRKIRFAEGEADTTELNIGTCFRSVSYCISTLYMYIHAHLY